MASGGIRSSRTENLERFLVDLEGYAPTVPDEVTQHCLRLSGMDCKEVPVVRLVSLAAQRLVASVAADAYEIQKRRVARKVKPGKEAGSKDDDVVLTSEVLGEALEEYGLSLKQPPYILDERGKGKRSQHPA
eukprot:jgi/Botrbrau1/18350/Bobra.0179s0075.1